MLETVLINLLNVRCGEMYLGIVVIMFLLNEVSVVGAGHDGQQILYISRDMLHLYNVPWKNSTKISKYLQHLIEVDYDFETQTIFYIIDSYKINQTNLITKEVQMVLSTDTNDIHHMSVDWVTKKIYFTGQDTMRIEVCNFDGSHRRVLFKKDIGNPRGIAVSPKHGLMFYTDIGDSPTIERLNMDGSDNKELVSTDIQFPSILAVDSDEGMVYWYDNDYFEKTLEMMKMDGSQRRKVVFETPDVYNIVFSSMTILGSRLYFSDGNMLSSCNQKNGTLTSCQTELSNLQGVLAIRAYGKRHQKYMNSMCQLKNGGCSHLCLLKPNGHSCACPTGLKLKSDGNTCASEIEKFIVYCTKRHLRIISLDADQHIDLTLPIHNLRTVYSVDYDPVDKMIYWTDIAKSNYGIIKRARLDGTGVETVVPEGFTLSDHLAIDWIARNLYWTCPQYNKIYVSRLDGSEIIVIVDTDLEEPRGVAVDPGDGRLYWSDWGAKNPKIESADLDGTNRVVLVNDSLQWPNGVAIDYLRRRLYWVDAGTDKIEFYDLVRKTRHSKPGSPHAFGVSILGDMIYWTDWQDRSLHKLDLINGKRAVVVQKIPDIMGMKAIDTTLRYGYNDCQNNSHGCSHFCFHKPRVGAVCACPDGYVIDDTKKGCVGLSGYLLYATQSYINALPLDAPKASASVPKITDNAITHVDTHVKSNQVVWANNSEDGHSATAIKSSLINDTSNIKIIQTGFYGPMGGIAIDWISTNIYWSQQHLKRIEVSRFDGRFRRTVVESKRAIRIRSLSINPRTRKLYWFEVYDKLDSRLYSSDLNGSNQKIIVNITGEPNGLVIDYNDSRIYWVAKNTHRIESIDLHGESRRLIARSLGTPVELAVFKNRLYFCEQERPDEAAPSISSVIKYGGTNKIVLKSESGVWFQDIAVHHNSLQIGENICDRRNGGCAHLCFATSVVDCICECEMHYTLDAADNSSCVGPSTFILLSERAVVYRVLLNEEPEVPINFNALISVTTIEYNIKTEIIYWLDTQARGIKFLSPARSIKTLDLKTENADPISFVIDFFTNLLYWVNKNTNSILFINLDDTSRNGIVFQNDNFRPRKLAILPEKGLLFFVNEYLTSTGQGYDSIESMTLAGTNLKYLHRFYVRYANSEHDGQYDITVDYGGERIYYLHRSDKRIESVGLSGGEPRVHIKFSKKLFSPVAIAVYGDNLYWLDVDIGTGYEKLKWCSIHNYARRKISNFPRIFVNTNDLLIVNLERRNKKHPCKVNNGGCSHICYVAYNKGGSLQAHCACPLGFVFKPSNAKECHACKKGESWCLLDTCMRSSAVCNDRADCVSGFNKNKDEDCKELYRSNRTTTVSPSVTGAVPQEHHTYSDVNKYTAGIVSGCVVTTLVLVFVMFIICRLQHKKQSMLRKQEQQGFLQREVCKFEAVTESVFVLPPNFHYKSLETVTDSVPPTNCSTELTNFRYITGSSTSYIPVSPSKLNDSIIMPINPPPSAISSSSLQDVSVCESNAFDSDMYESLQLPAPPSTPLYTPSEVESTIDGHSLTRSRTCLPYDKQNSFGPHSCVSHDLTVSLRSQHPCADRYNQQNCIYGKKHNSHERYMRTRGHHHRPAPSLASSYLTSLWRPLNSHNSCGSSIDSRRRQSLTRQLSHLTSIADCIEDSGGGQLPSLASGEYTSSSSVSSQKTIQQFNENYEADSNVFSSYAPPPTPREIDALNLQELNDDEAYEVAILLEESPEEVTSNSIEIF